MGIKLRNHWEQWQRHINIYFCLCLGKEKLNNICQLQAYLQCFCQALKMASWDTNHFCALIPFVLLCMTFLFGLSTYKLHRTIYT